MRIGRPPFKSGHVDGLEGPSREKERLRAILKTLSGDTPVAEACEELHLSRTHFNDLRARALQAALDGLISQVSGRKRKVREVDPSELERLQSENEYLRDELDIARVRTELALVMPHVLREPEPPWGKKPARSGRSSKRSSKRRSGTTRGCAR
ncbi:MAG: helix-turn-helix domain-containing protein [bacterium]|nr:helix-turn-helix domain-containing protein [bacterium]